MQSAKETDPIAPSQIEHDVDFSIKGGRYIVDYNFLVYQFEKPGIYCRARTCLDEPWEVSIFPCRKTRDSIPVNSVTVTVVP